MRSSNDQLSPGHYAYMHNNRNYTTTTFAHMGRTNYAQCSNALSVRINYYALSITINTCISRSIMLLGDTLVGLPPRHNCPGVEVHYISLARLARQTLQLHFSNQWLCHLMFSECFPKGKYAQQYRAHQTHTI